MMKIKKKKKRHTFYTTDIGNIRCISLYNSNIFHGPINQEEGKHAINFVHQ